MDEADNLERALAELVYSKKARATWRAVGPGALGLTASEAEALAGLDPVTIEQLARAVRRLVLSRRYRGTGGLVDWYPRTLAAWRALHPEADAGDLDELAAELLDSPHGAAWRETAEDELGLSLEEAFFRFAEEASIGDREVRTDEFLSALVRALAIDPEPAFLVPACVHRAPAGWFAVAPGSPPVLHAALSGRVLRGPITPLLASLLDGAEPADLAVVHGLSVGDVIAARAALEAMGLLGPLAATFQL